uniref:Uncharacterized protein n=1 Tax=Acrobeloides nanus TaxID=290746 RepID=A0A914DK09_9BILA
MVVHLDGSQEVLVRVPVGSESFYPISYSLYFYVLGVVQNALNALGSTKVNVLWLDIENSQYQQWSTDTSTNQQFFVNLWNAAVPYAGKSFDYLGVYSFKTQWDPVMGDTFNAGLPATTPIWWARYNSNTV